MYSAPLELALDLAGNRLECFECNLRTEDAEERGRALQKIGAFTALTRLEISGLRPAGADFAALRDLPLQELALLHCQNLEVELILPGAMRLLRKLHIEEVDRRIRKVKHRKPQTMEQLAACSRSLLSLPSLSELSGSAVLFNVVMKDVLANWHEADYRKGSMAVTSLERPANVSRLRVWTKP